MRSAGNSLDLRTAQRVEELALARNAPVGSTSVLTPSDELVFALLESISDSALIRCRRPGKRY